MTEEKFKTNVMPKKAKEIIIPSQLSKTKAVYIVMTTKIQKNILCAFFIAWTSLPFPNIIYPKTPINVRIVI